jgi:NADPH-dependent 2,4-dienoyl-CoA reductase/sulfur reductase-like enzyme
MPAEGGGVAASSRGATAVVGAGIGGARTAQELLRAGDRGSLVLVAAESYPLYARYGVLTGIARAGMAGKVTRLRTLIGEPSRQFDEVPA